MVTRILFPVGLSADGTVRRSLAGGCSTRCVVSGLLVGTVVLTDPQMLGFTYFLPRTPGMVQSRASDLCEFFCSCRIRGIFVADRAVPVFHIAGCGTGRCAATVLCSVKFRTALSTDIPVMRFIMLQGFISVMGASAHSKGFAEALIVVVRYNLDFLRFPVQVLQN